LTICWRICRRGHSRNAFDGKGAAAIGGRWNRPGTLLVYTSSSLALAALEILVNIGAADLPSDLVAVAAEMPADLEKIRVEARNLPKSWRLYPAPDLLAEIGEDWVRKGETAVLVVPSAVVPEECNFLLNPSHPCFQRIAIGKARPFEFDPRIGKIGKP
jgi:RES domain-containing protein